MPKDSNIKIKHKKLIAAVCVAALIIAAAAAAVLYVGTDNIKALYYGVKYDKEQINTMRDESTKRLDDKVAEADGVTARAPTEEEMAALTSGEIDDNQLADILSSDVTLDEYRESGYKVDAQETETNDADDGTPESSNAQSGTPAQPKAEPKAEPETKAKDDQALKSEECDKLVSQIVAKMYILRSSFTSSIESLAGQAYADYKAGTDKSTIMSSYIGQVQSLENQCDGSVDALMSELTGILTTYGRTTELVDTIYETYNSEKQYTKAYYMNLYLNN